MRRQLMPRFLTKPIDVFAVVFAYFSRGRHHEAIGQKGAKAFHHRGFPIQPSTNPAQPCLSSMFRWVSLYSGWYERKISGVGLSAKYARLRNNLIVAYGS